MITEIITLNHLSDANDVELYYNDMDFDDFVELVEDYVGFKFNSEIVGRFKYTGLSNVDFFKLYSQGI